MKNGSQETKCSREINPLVPNYKHSKSATLIVLAIIQNSVIIPPLESDPNPACCLESFSTQHTVFEIYRSKSQERSLKLRASSGPNNCSAVLHIHDRSFEFRNPNSAIMSLHKPLFLALHAVFFKMSYENGNFIL